MKILLQGDDKLTSSEGANEITGKAMIECTNENEGMSAVDENNLESAIPDC